MHKLYLSHGVLSSSSIAQNNYMNRHGYILPSILSQLSGAQYLDNFTVGILGCTPGLLSRCTSPHSVDGRNQCISPSHGHSTEVPLLSAWMQPTAKQYNSQSYRHSTEVPLLPAWTRPVYLTVPRTLYRSTSSLSVYATGVSHSLTGTQPKYLSSQRGRPVYLAMSQALNRSTSSLSVDATGVSHCLTGTQLKYLSSEHGCDRTARRCIS
jgi:hypothetical protein